MKRSIKNIVLLVFIYTIYGCIESKNRSANELITGFWIINKIEFNYQDIHPCMYINTIYFNKNKSVDLPTIKKGCLDGMYGNLISEGVWDINLRGDSMLLEINTSNDLFNNKFKIENCTDNKNSKTKIKLISNNLYIEASKN